jgi:anti-sigma factor ChrR (cupin superfamily)
MIGHPDADTLAACREGLLGRRRSARIRAHLARCSRCASLDHELAAVTSLLASAPAPRIPDELAARLDTVLAAESAARARGESPAADGIPAAADRVPAADGIQAAAGTRARPTDGRAAPADGQAIPGRKAGPRPDRSRSGRPPRAWRVTALRAASVTAALLVIAGGGYGVSRLLQGGGGAASSSTSSGAGGSSGTRPHANAPLGGSSAPVSPRAGLPIPAGEIRVVHTGNDYQPGRLVTQAQALLASHPAKFGGAMASIAAPPSTTLRGCVKLVAGAVHPTVVDEARYNGQPATIIVNAPAAGHSGRVWVIVPSCSAAGRQLVQTAVLPASG